MTPQSVDDRVTTYGSLLRACETAAVLLGGPQLVLQCGYGRCDPAWALSLYAARYIQLKRAHQAPGLRRVRDTTHQYAAPLTFFFSTGSTPWVLSGSHEFAWLSWNGQLA